uniref:Transposase n=1 Tax=Strongyloides papillosus TaxID=174720 RepID=A0A0N5BS59_STREA
MAQAREGAGKSLRTMTVAGWHTRGKDDSQRFIEENLDTDGQHHLVEQSSPPVASPVRKRPRNSQGSMTAL